jgi:O-antigen ligase/polysaccharide polymerase Wzy-like membrane protein
MAWRSPLANRFGEVKFSARNGASSYPPAGSVPITQKQSVLAPLMFHRHPTFTAAAVFLLALSGPPRFRIRDPEASLRGDLDWVVVLHLMVWGAAGLWILWQMAKRYQAKRPLLRLRLPQILGLVMIVFLAASIFVSDAQALTAFKVYQMLVLLLFTEIFVERFGAWTSLKTMLWGNALLCSAIAFCAFFVPDEVWTYSEFHPDPSRLFGGRIAATGVVSMLAIILLLTSVRKIWRIFPLAMLVSLAALLLASLMRTAYVTAFVFFVLVLLKRPNIRSLRRIAYFLLGLSLLLYAFGRLPRVSDYRDPATVGSLGDRIGLWRHLTTVTLGRSPWLGMGYYAASRVHGPEYNPGLGTAHSVFFEVLSGGGVLGFSLLTALCLMLCAHTVRLLYTKSDRLSFATSALFIACLLFGLMGEELDSGPVAMGFWFCAAVLPRLSEQSLGLVQQVCRPSPELIESGLEYALPPPEVV